MTEQKDKPNWEDALDFKKEIAKRVKAYREAKKYTHEKLAKKTKIPLITIHQIEEASDEFYQQKVFAYGFIKILCKELKVPSEELLELCDKCFPKENSYLDSIADFKALASKKQNQSYSIISKVFQWKTLKSLSLAIMFFFVVSFFYTLYQSDDQEIISSNTSSQKKEKETHKDLLEEKATANIINKKELSQASKTLPQQTTTLDPSICPKTEAMEKQEMRCVSLKVKAPTKFAAITDKNHGEEKIYEPGIYHFYYNEALEFTLDDASQVELIQGEKNWGVLSQRKEKKRLKFFNRDLINPESIPELKL